MLRTHCEHGSALETAYMQTTLRWVNAEARKRLAVAVSSGIDVQLWHEIARRAASARNDHDHALWTYIDHIVACPECYPARTSVASTAVRPNPPDPSALPEIVPAARHRGSH